MYINEFDEIPFEAVTYLTGECNYGGRITDDWDRRTINTILNKFCCPQVVENPYYLFCDVDQKYGIPFRAHYHDFIKQIEVEIIKIYCSSCIHGSLIKKSTFFL